MIYRLLHISNAYISQTKSFILYIIVLNMGGGISTYKNLIYMFTQLDQDYNFHEKKNGNLLLQSTLQQILLFKILQDSEKCLKEFQNCLHNTINKIDKNKIYLNELCMKRNKSSHKILRNKIHQLWHLKQELIKFDKFIHYTKLDENLHKKLPNLRSQNKQSLRQQNFKVNKNTHLTNNKKNQGRLRKLK